MPLPLRFEPLSEKRVKRLGFFLLFLLSVVLLVNLASLGNGLDLKFTVSRLAVLLLAAVVNVGVVFIRGFVFYLAAKSQSLNYTFGQSLSLTFRADFISLTTFPGKIFSDGYKFFTLRQNQAKGSLTSVIIFRGALILGTFWPLTLLVLRLGVGRWLLVVILALAVVGLWLKKRWQQYHLILSNLSVVAVVIGLSFIAAAAIGVLFFQFALVASIFGLKPSFDLYTIFILVYVLSGLSNIPFGFGVVEISYFIYLSPYLAPAAIATFLVWLRLTGPMLSAVVGWGLLTRRTFRPKIIT